MTQRRVSWLIGGGVAALALVLLLTTVPVTQHPAESQPIALHASSSEPGVPACATMRLEGELESQRTTPLVNLWGLSQVATTIVAPTVFVGGDAPCPDGVDVADSHVIVFTPDCDNPTYVVSDESFDDVVEEAQSRCDGAGVQIPGLAGDEGYDATTSYNTGGRFPLAESGLVAADAWCLGSLFGVSYRDGNTVNYRAADEVEGDICVDLS